jgi:hypothetical protein
MTLFLLKLQSVLLPLQESKIIIIAKTGPVNGGTISTLVITAYHSIPEVIRINYNCSKVDVSTNLATGSMYIVAR